jgi:cytochrome c
LVTLVLVLGIVGLLALVAQAQGPAGGVEYGLGEGLAPEAIASFNIHPAIPPDGRGLPEGSGSVDEGATVYQQKCAHCHGSSGREGPFDVLVGPDDPYMGADSTRNIGNFWPYATTVYDFISRAMPFDAPGSLSPDEVYAVTAWLLHQNEIVGADAVMNAESLPQVEMPARDLFHPDPRWVVEGPP